MTAQIAARTTAAPQTPPLPRAKPESLGLSAARLQILSDAFKARWTREPCLARP